MDTYINLIQHSGGVEFDLNANDGSRMPPQLITEGDSYHGTYLIPAPPQETLEMLQRILSDLDNGAPAKVKRKKVQKKLAKYEVAPAVTH
jgi:hypothetical protein